MTEKARQSAFLTNHAHVLLAIAHDRRARLRDIAAACYITERTAQNVVTDLADAGYLRRERTGRRTQYTLNPDGPLRHPAEAGLTIRALLALAQPHEHRPSDITFHRC